MSRCKSLDVAVIFFRCVFFWASQALQNCDPLRAKTMPKLSFSILLENDLSLGLPSHGYRCLTLPRPEVRRPNLIYAFRWLDLKALFEQGPSLIELTRRSCELEAANIDGGHHHQPARQRAGGQPAADYESRCSRDAWCRACP